MMTKWRQFYLAITAIFLSLLCSQQACGEPQLATIVYDKKVNPKCTPDDQLSPDEHYKRAKTILDNIDRGYNDNSEGYVCTILAALEGHARAQAQLGRLYSVASEVNYYGSGSFFRDYEAAKYWLFKAAEAKDNMAYYQLGQLYAQGLGVPESDEEAIKWFQLAKESGYPYASQALSLLASRRNMENALIASLEPKAVSGDVMAQARLGEVYFNGEVRRNDEKAIKWLTLASDAKNPKAESLLGKAYLNGRGVKSDPNKAFDLLLAAGDAGYHFNDIPLLILANSDQIDQTRKDALSKRQEASSPETNPNIG